MSGTWNSNITMHLVLIATRCAIGVAAGYLLRRQRFSDRQSLWAACAVVASPVGYELFLWPSTLCTNLSILLLIVALLIAQHAAAGGSRPGIALLLPVLVAVMCGLNEQPVAGFAAIPVFLSRCVDARARRTIVIALGISALVVVAYLVLMRASVPAGQRGGADSYRSVTEIARSVFSWLRECVEAARIAGVAGGAWAIGLSLVSGPLALLAITASSMWCVLARRSEQLTQGGAGPRWVQTAVLSLIAGVASFLPCLVIRGQSPDSRLCGVVSVFEVLFVAAVVQPLCLIVGKRRILQGIGRITATCVLCGAVIASAGLGENFRLRHALTCRQAVQLLRLYPTPSPGSVFVPLKVNDAPTRTAFHRFDHAFGSVWEYPWAGQYFVRLTYARKDVTAIHYPRWPGMAGVVLGIERDGIRLAAPVPYLDFLFPPDASGRWLVPWNQVIPFVVDEHGNIRPVAHIRLRVDGGDNGFASVDQHAALSRGLTVDILGQPVEADSDAP